MSEADPIVGRMEEQIAWYDRKSISSQRIYKRIKLIEIVAAATIPFLAGMELPHGKWIVGALGVLITILEGTIQLNQYQHNWVSYRATCEALKHEKYVYVANAGPYAAVVNPRGLLAERIESILSQENVKWAVAQQSAAKGKEG